VSLHKSIAWINSVGGAMTTLVACGGAAVAVHNWWFMDKMAPVIRASLVTRINNYRALECEGMLEDDQRVAFDLAQAQYEDLVGRSMGRGTGCEEAEE